MITTPQEIRMLTGELSISAWTLAAIGALFESGLVDQLREPRSLDELARECPKLSRGRIERTLAVAVAAGAVGADAGRYRLADGMMAYLQQPMRAGLAGDIRAQLMQAVAFLDAASRGDPGTGWRHTDPAVLQAQGDASAGLAAMVKMVAPRLGDLAARLDRPGARFLDVGVGVAALAIAMARAYPQLHTVGLDPYDAALAIARANVAAAELGSRIELRQVALDDLRDDAAFDLIWLPSFFLTGFGAAAMARAHAALRPGGWILLCAMAGGDGRTGAVFDLINELWGGAQLSTADVESLLETTGLTAIQRLPGPPGAPALVVGQRAS